MKKMTYIFNLVAVAMFTQFAFADAPDWVDNPGAYEFTATISGGIVLDGDDMQMGDDGDMFAAFDEDGHVRGLAVALYPPFGPYAGTCVWEMQMRSNSGGDLLSFKYYDSSEDIVLDITQTYEFIIILNNYNHIYI